MYCMCVFEPYQALPYSLFTIVHNTISDINQNQMKFKAVYIS
jgi:hypothetical protein